MSFNHRIVKSEDGSFHVHEVYYDENGNIESWTENPVTPSGFDTTELHHDFELHLKAFKKPILVIDGGTLKNL
jgi:YD repeat-containing protein